MIIAIFFIYLFDLKKTKMAVRIVNKSQNPLPAYETSLSAGMDLRADVGEYTPVTIKPLERVLIHTNLFIELPEGFEAQIRPRSGLAIVNGITVLNSPGTIDADYRGEIGVILVNLSSRDFTVYQGDRIAQMVISECTQIEWDNVLVLSETKRSKGGFGHTGKK